MSSFVSSILHNSANKIESMSMRGSRNNSKNQNRKSSPNLTSRLAVYGASTPTLSSPSYCYHPQMSYSAEYVPSVAPPPPPPYGSPTPTPSTSWTSEMSALAEKIKDDVTSSFKGKQQQLQQQQIDRHSISQGMKLVSIAADEYEDGNESVALDIYLTGVDKIIMALPSKKMSIFIIFGKMKN